MLNDVPYLKFRYVKNQMLSFPNGRSYPIPMQMKELHPDQAGGAVSKLDANRSAVVPIFNMKKVHDYPLEDESFSEVDEDGISEALRKELQDDLYRNARVARTANDGVRKWFYHYAQQGVIEIVDDPFFKRVIKVGKTQKSSEIFAHPTGPTPATNDVAEPKKKDVKAA